MEILSYFFNILSMVFYGIVYFPQLKLIYKTKSSDNISIWMVVLWTQGDTLSLISSILMGLDISFLILGWYYLFLGSVMISFVLYYSNLNFQFKNFFLIIGVIFIDILSCILVNILIKTPEKQIGNILGWITTTFYLSGRAAQIITMYKSKNSQGISMMMYGFTILGNSFYLISLLTYSLEPYYIQTVSPWIVLIVVTVLCDLLILFLCKLYENQHNQNIENNQNIEYNKEYNQSVKIV